MPLFSFYIELNSNKSFTRLLKISYTVHKQIHPNKTTWTCIWRWKIYVGTIVYQGTTGNISEANRLSILPPIIKFLRCDIFLHCEMEWRGLHRKTENRVSHLQIFVHKYHTPVTVDEPELYSRSESSRTLCTEWPIFHENGECMSAQQSFDSLQSQLLPTTWDAHDKCFNFVLLAWATIFLYIPH